MKRILCFGDSNTWGYVPGSDVERYDVSIRYPRVLATLLGEDFEVIEEGLPGRTLCADTYKPAFGNRNGTLAFAQSVYSHLPLDYVLIMLGTNDMKFLLHKTTKDCANALEESYIKPIKDGLGGKIKTQPIIIIVAPAKIVDDEFENFSNAINKTSSFNEDYKKVADKYGALFVDNEGLINGVDYIHLTAESHVLLANKIYKVIKENL